MQATRSPSNPPPTAVPEQRAIAAVLDSIDEAIECTEAVIAAAERLRDALLHELLTRGVPGWHSEWKEAPGIGTIASVLGRSAAGGCVRRCATEQRHLVLGLATWQHGVVPFVRTGQVHDVTRYESIRLSSSPMMAVTLGGAVVRSAEGSRVLDCHDSDKARPEE